MPVIIPGGGGVLRISSDGDEIFYSRIFLGRKIWQVFFSWLDLKRDFWGVFEIIWRFVVVHAYPDREVL